MNMSLNNKVITENNKTITDYHERDSAYIEAFCEDPKAGKSAALEKAGYTGEYIAQEAYRIHKRLKDRIEERLTEQLQEGASLGHSVLMDLVKNASSESVKFSSAKALLEFGGRKPTDKLAIQDSRPQSIEDMDAEIVTLQRELGYTS